jgi:hypothetical protein
MNNNKKIIQVGLLLFGITMALFFLLFFLFSTQGSMSEAQYFNYSAVICCFILPTIYAGVGFYSPYSSAKKEVLHFGQVWRLSFLPMFIGGLLSMASIFVFFNTNGGWAEDSLQRGWHDLMFETFEPALMDETLDAEETAELEVKMTQLEKMTDLSVNLFSWKIFFISFSFILFFYFLISTIFAVFLKNRRV